MTALERFVPYLHLENRGRGSVCDVIYQRKDPNKRTVVQFNEEQQASEYLHSSVKQASKFLLPP